MPLYLRVLLFHQFVDFNGDALNFGHATSPKITASDFNIASVSSISRHVQLLAFVNFRHP
jgi:hypothetical protein